MVSWGARCRREGGIASSGTLIRSTWSVQFGRTGLRSVARLGGSDGGLDRLATGITDSHGESPGLRRILVDLIEEYARHVGHADLIRESVDGLTGEDPPD